MKKGFFTFIISLFSLLTSNLVCYAADYDHHDLQKFNYPQREFSIIATDEGYYPEKIILFEGEKAKFFVTSSSNKPDCFLIKNHEVFLSAMKGKITEAEVVFRHAGEYPIYCPSTNHKGKVIVLGKKEKSNFTFETERNVASEKEIEAQWMPKDY